MELQPSDFSRERARRAALLSTLQTIDPELTQVPALTLRKLGVYSGARGTYWREVAADSGAFHARVVLSILHTGRHYADELSDNSLLYRYPATKLPAHDQSDIAAGKLAMRLELPIFVSLSPLKKSPLRSVRIGYVLDADDDARQFLVGFGPRPISLPLATEEVPFQATREAMRKKRRSALIRANDQPRFAFRVGKRYGPKCAFCQVSIRGLLDAAHIVGVSRLGSDDPRNGIPLCKNHHAAFDAGFIRISDDGRTIETSPLYTRAELGITEVALATATGKMPHVEAIRLRNGAGLGMAPQPERRSTDSAGTRNGPN